MVSVACPALFVETTRLPPLNVLTAYLVNVPANGTSGWATAGSTGLALSTGAALVLAEPSLDLPLSRSQAVPLSATGTAKARSDSDERRRYDGMWFTSGGGDVRRENDV